MNPSYKYEPGWFPQSSAMYADEKDLFGSLMIATQALVVARPKNPVQFLIQHFLRKSHAKLRLSVIGPPFSGRQVLARKIAQTFDMPLLELGQLTAEADPTVQIAAWDCIRKRIPLPPELAFTLLRKKIFSDECVEKGWILCGFPETRAQDELFRKQGICPQKIICLSGSLEKLDESCRNLRYDPVDKCFYNTTHSSLPTDDQLLTRLVNWSCDTPENVRRICRNFSYQAMMILRNASRFSKEDPVCILLNGNQPVEKIYNDALRFVSIRPLQHRSYMHRLILFGRPGSGKKSVANKLLQTFSICQISSGSLILRAATDPEHQYFREINVFFSQQKPIPDDIVGNLVLQALKDSDLQGFVLRGFPQNRTQADFLSLYGYRPSKVFFFNCSESTSSQRVLAHGRILLTKVAQLTYSQNDQTPPVPSGCCLGLKGEEEQSAALRTANQQYSEMENDMRNLYKDRLFDIDANQDENAIFDQVKFILLHPQPLRPKL